MRNINVFVKEKNYELPVTELVSWKFDELVNGRVFETLQDVQYTLLALQRGASKYSLEHGMACPRDTQKAIKKIKSLPKY